MHSINLDAVIKSEYPVVIRVIAEKLKKIDYLDVGTFLQELSKADLEELVGYCDAIIIHKDHDKKFDCIVLLGEMLSQAEGAPLDTPDISRTVNLMILLTFEDLARKNVIEFDREKATLSDDLTQIDIARLK